MTLQPLPIDELLPDLTDTLKRCNSLVLVAPPGAGKTTRVPPAILDASLAGGKQIVLLQPRRLAALAAAARMAEERGTTLGDQIGYRVRFAAKAGRQTRIVAMTDGLFLRQLQTDPLLENVGVVLFDEFHERSVDIDLALALVRRLQVELRDDLKIVVMSATLAAGPVARYLGDCPVLESPGRLHPVDVNYLKHSRQEPVPLAAATAARRILAATAGHVLVFLPGMQEIRRTLRELEPLANTQAISLHPLHGEMPLADQQAVLHPSGRRKIVVATNVAETSITIEGVTGVVDSGLARRLEFDAAHGLNRLELVRISRASADQRAGRAGRTAPGVCLRLWTEREQQAMAEHDVPEIARVDLAGALLAFIAWGQTNPTRFAWFEPPPADAVERAVALLQRLGLIGERGLTPFGRRVAHLPVHPRIGRLLVEGRALGNLPQAALAAALLSERDPFRRRSEGPRETAAHRSRSDVLDRVTLLEEFAAASGHRSTAAGFNREAARFILRARDQLIHNMERDPEPVGDSGTHCVPLLQSREIEPAEALERALLAAFPDRLARRREPGSRRAVMIGGRGVRLSDQSAVTEAQLFVCVDVQPTAAADMLVHQASAVERQWLPHGELQSTIELAFDSQKGRVVALRQTRLEDLVLDESPTSVPPSAAAAALLAQAAATQLQRSEWLTDDARTFLARIALLRRWMPQLDWPSLDEDHCDELLPQLCEGCISLDELRRAPLLQALKGRCTARQLAALDREAPLQLQVPSGRKLPLVYEPNKPPVLAVRIQEIFGWRETPRIAAGRAPVLLHLLAPNLRPEQVTSDLASFWQNTYPQVRKELKRRYPKHAWPEDPLSARAESRPSRKK